MTFKGHVLKHNKGSEFPRNWVFFDCETYIAGEDDEKQIQQLRLGVAQYWRFDKTPPKRKEVVFRSSSELYTFILSCLRKKTRLFVAAHNLAFDLSASGIIQCLFNGGWKVTKVMIESAVNAMVFKRNKSTIVFIDTLNFWRMPLEKLGSSVGLNKLRVDPFTADDPALIEYCRRDVEILAHAVWRLYEFIKQNDLGGFGLSVSQLAFNAFRHKFMKHAIYIHEYKPAIELERAAYFGGRNECFRIGHVNGPIYKLDVNSMYPFVMQHNVFPVRLVHFFDTPIPVSVLARFLNTHTVVAEVKVNCDEPVYPYRRDDGKIIFPVGTFVTYLCTASLKYAIEHGHIVEVRKAAIYESAPIFNDYVDFFYNMRLEWKNEGKDAFAFMAKIMLNSLYGKFGQRQYRSEIVPRDCFPTLNGFFEYEENGERYRCYTIGDKVIMIKRTEDKAFNAFVAIAAHVTDYARMKLWYLIKKARRRNVLYCDTDSLFVTEQGFQNLCEEISDNELGKLKLEEVMEYIKLYGPKDYVTPSQIKIKGVKKDAQRISDNVFLQYNFPTLKRVVRDNLFDRVVLRKVTKELKRQYDKGLVDPEGNVMPIPLNQFV